MQTTTDVMSLPRGGVRLLTSAVAQRLLTSTELARVAYVAAARTPRVRPAWVGVLDYQTRFPGDTTAEEWARRGTT